MMLVTPVPWAQRVWALPFVTVRAPSERSHDERQNTHTTITDGAKQRLTHLRRWVPERTLVMVADGTAAVLDVLGSVTQLATVIVVTRLRLDACVSDRPASRTAGTKGRPALKGKAHPTLHARRSDPATVWQKDTVVWDGGISREVDMATGTAVWSQSPTPPVPIR